MASLPILTAILLAGALQTPPTLQCPVEEKPSPQTMAIDEFLKRMVEENWNPPMREPTRYIAMPQGDLASVRIKLSRHFYSVGYDVEVRGDGTVRYFGSPRGPLLEGRHATRIDPQHVRSLVEKFREADFWSLENYDVEVSDTNEAVLEMTIGGRRKVVVDHGGEMAGMPKRVRDLQRAVDEVTGARRWAEGNDETIPYLRAIKWDFGSRKSSELLKNAVDARQEAVVLGLLESGAKPDPKSAIMANAAFWGDLKVIRALVAAGGFSKGSGDATKALPWAVWSCSTDVVAEYRNYGADIRTFGNPLRRENLAFTAVEMCLSDQKDKAKGAEMVAYLVRAGVSPNQASGWDGGTPLHRVTNAEAVKALVANGAQLEVRNNSGITPVVAVYDQSARAALIDAGAHLSAADRSRLIEDACRYPASPGVLDALTRRDAASR